MVICDDFPMTAPGREPGVQPPGIARVGVLASSPMRIRSSIVVVAKFAAISAIAGAAACGGGGAGKIMADTTILPYQAPDIDELTGIDPDEAETTDGEGAGSGSSQAPQK
jgi:hypothetical protein